MSSNVFVKQDPSPVQTRRAPIRNNEMENNSQRQNNRRSLSGKFRNLFRKNSSSPTRPARNNNNEERPPPAPIRQKSPSPEPIRTPTEAPHLRAPLINWPFGKKKNKLTTTTSEKPKRKEKRKSKKISTPSMEISSPVYEQEHQTSIRGQNFIPRTPELTHTATGRTQSSSSYETTTKGFRDYMIVDNARTSQQVILPDVDIITPPPYTSARSRSPSLNQQTLSDTNIQHTYHRDISSSISEIDIIPIPKQQQYTVDSNSSLTATQILVENTPLVVTQPIDITPNSDQWKNTSHSSFNNTELHSTTSSSIDVDSPKLNAPSIPLNFTSNKKDSYNSSSTINNPPTYTSLPDTTTTIHNDNFTPLKPKKSSLNKYPTLSAIVEHHMRPVNSIKFNENSSITTTTPKRNQRFDTSTTTSNNYDQQQQWSTNINNDSSIHHHDGFIRPLTPPKSPIQPDISTIHVDLEDLRCRSPSSRPIHNNHSIESPIIYRSSTVIYTRDRHNYTDGGGQLRTWSIQENDNNHQKSSTSIQIPSSRMISECRYTIGTNEQENNYERQQYSINRYSDNTNLTRSDERERIYDPSTRSYKVTEHIQESERELRHYTLKRTSSYDGLGIFISADAETRLNHRIRDVERGSPGSQVGLRKNDRIVNVNGINVENTDFGDVLVLIKQGLKNNNLQFSVTNESILI